LDTLGAKLQTVRFGKNKAKPMPSEDITDKEKLL